MSLSGLPAFDSTIHTTNVWLHDVMDQMAWQDKHRAYVALRAVLHALRDRLSVDQVAGLGAQLPMLVRGMYYEGWHPAGKPLKERQQEAFLAHVRQELHNHPEINTEAATRAVFRVLAKHVTPGEVRHVKVTLPGELRSLWEEETHSIWF